MLLITILHQLHHSVFYNHALSCRAVFTLPWLTSPRVNRVVVDVCLSNLCTYFFCCQKVSTPVVVATAWNGTPTLAIFKGCKSVMVCDYRGEETFCSFYEEQQANRQHILLYVWGGVEKKELPLAFHTPKWDLINPKWLEVVPFVKLEILFGCHGAPRRCLNRCCVPCDR